MSSEEMRVELEAFVNAGLREGWRGWPLKEESRMSRTSDLPLYAKLVGIQSRWSRRLRVRGEQLRAFVVGSRYCAEN
jgi:hypothetical protein